MAIHPLAVVHSTAQLGQDVEIGPFAVIEEGVKIGDRCRIESQVVIKAATELGDDNHLFEGAVIGGLPQHVRAPEHAGDVIIGSGNTIREHVTIHRAMHAGQATTIGDHNLLMVGMHVAHDCHVGSHTIIANHTSLAGHVTVDDRAFVSGNVGVHQYCRIGRLAMVGGLARVVKDVPPFVTIDGQSGFVVGINTVGLRRSGYTASDINQLKAAYRLIYRSGLTWDEMRSRLAMEFASGPAACFNEFFAGTARGIVQERRLPPGAAIRLRDDAVEAAPDSVESAPPVRFKAG